MRCLGTTRRTRRIFRAIPIAALLALAPAGEVVAQLIPGPESNAGYWELQKALVQRAAMDRMRQTVRAWEDALTRGDMDRLAELYAPNAVLLSPGGVQAVHGGEGLREALARTLPALASMRLVMLDFSGSVILSFGSGRFFAEPAETGGGTIAGDFVMVFERDGDRAMIRTHLFRPDAACGAGAPGRSLRGTALPEP